MTTEDDFQNHLEANPDDHHTRLVFADWLQERNDPRAEGYRALGAMKKYPLDYYHRLTGRIDHSWLNLHDVPINRNNYTIPDDWFNLIEGHDNQIHNGNFSHKEFIGRPRRLAEDAAAHAFSKLPEERKKELLDNATKFSRVNTASNNQHKLIVRYSKTHGGKRPNAGRVSLPSSKRKKPVTTWLTPAEIRKLSGMGKGRDAQDGIRDLVAKAMKGVGSGTCSTPQKKSRASILELVSNKGKKFVVRRMSRNKNTPY